MDDVWYNAEIFKDAQWKQVVQTKDFDYATWCISYHAYDGLPKRIVLTEMSAKKLEPR